MLYGIFNFKEVLSSTPQEREKLTRLLDQSWAGVHAYMSKLPHNQRSVETLLKMIWIERKHKKREQILHRLYRCAANMRREIEEAHLYD